MKKGMISPSLMCLDLMNAEAGVRELEKVGADYLHVDIMDNHFVPNITLSADFVRALRTVTKVPLDIHLMIEKPENSLQAFADCSEKDIVCIHYEATVHIERALQEVKKLGCRVGIALNPGTPLCVLEDLIPDIDMVLIMTVNPGFAGQKLVPATLDKISRCRTMLRKLSPDREILIEVDGNVSFENAKKMRKCGADIFVAGSSSIFGKDGTLAENYKRLKQAIR
jgi:ribulose-phosphate 3-epimerase